jgi:CheY-like chemotaxis protein
VDTSAEQLFDDAPVALVAVDSKGAIIRLNQAAARALELDPARAQGARFTEQLDAPERVVEFLSRCARGPCTEGGVHLKDGRPVLLVGKGGPGVLQVAIIEPPALSAVTHRLRGSMTRLKLQLERLERGEVPLADVTIVARKGAAALDSLARKIEEGTGVKVVGSSERRPHTTLRAPAGTRGAVLVVEDDRDIRAELADVLREVGYDVDTASDGIEALARLRETPLQPDVILLDLNMPNMDGAAFREHQLEDARIAKIPVVLISGAADVEDEARRLRAAATVVKPFTIESVADAIKRARAA